MGRIGIIGGSGLYNLEGLIKKEEISVATPFGDPSDKFMLGELDGKEVVFLPRHGRDHNIGPSWINYRANIYGMKKLGVTRIISVSACGSLKEEIKPLDFVIPTQFVDRTNQSRKMTFFDQGIVAHVAFAHPVCMDMAKYVYEIGKSIVENIHFGGVYLNMEGPQFSTLAESNLYRSWGMDIIGMTNLAEARLAREAQLCYVSLSAVTDYDCWHESEETVSAEMVLENLKKNVENAKRILKKVVAEIPEERTCGCKDALKYAIVTDLNKVPQEIRDRLKLILE